MHGYINSLAALMLFSRLSKYGNDENSVDITLIKTEGKG